MMWGYGYSGWGWMWIVGAVVIIAIVVLIVFLARKSTALTATGGADKSATTPRQILDERYARGELTTDEYRERITTLGGTQ